ncbi:hypothetical protein [Bacillus sp. JCM 19041]|uniref:hypothetical protein n=1 Tax=Bacillus sp. JCM 19041 TaxID=1460637 RepID=UPI000B27B1F6
MLADHTKFGDIAFSKFADANKVTLVTSSYVKQENARLFEQLTARTTVEVVEL